MGSSPPTAPLPPLREVIAAHGLRARKHLGQHFLLDLNLTARIARAGGPLTQGTIVEIGPGPGGLTRALLDNGAQHVIAIERDPRMLPILQQVAAAYPKRLDVIHGDALQAGAHMIGEAPRRIIANLPYNIATPLITSWLQHAGAFERIVVMVQREVAGRLAARQGSKEYARLSVFIQWLCQVETLFDVNPQAFSPPPAVVSTVVRLTPRARPLAPCGFKALTTTTAVAFNQRRKMLRSSLKPLAAKLGTSSEALCASVGIAPTARAEELSIETFCALARAVETVYPHMAATKSESPV